MNAAEPPFTDQVLDAIGDIFFVFTAEGTLLQWNQRVGEVTGYSDEEIAEMHPAQFVADEDAELVRRHIKKVLENGETRFEARYRTKEGREIPYEFVGSLLEHDGERLICGIGRDISEKKRTEEALRTSERRYRRLFEESRDAVVLTTPEGAIVDVNDATKKLFGYSREELLNLDAAELYADPEERRNRIVPTLKESTSSRILEAEMRHREGHTFIATASVTVHRDEEGYPELIQALVRDVTERKQRKEELATQKQKAERKNTLLRLMQRVASTSNEVERFEDALQEAVDAICEHTGWPVGHVFLRVDEEDAGSASSEEEVLETNGIWNRGREGRFDTFKEATAPLSFARGEGLPGQVLETGEPAWIEDVTDDPDFPQSKAAEEVGIKGAFSFPVSLEGEVQAVLEFFSEEVESPNPELLDAMESVGMQLSRVAEREKAINALAASEERYHRLFEDAQEGIAITTPAGEILDANPAALEIFGYSREEMRSIQTPDLYVDPAERKEATQELQENGAIQGREFRLHRADGEEIICRLSATLRYGPNGEPKAFMTFFRDVTERKRAEEALKESEEMFRKLAEGALVGIGLIQNGTYEYVNPALANITGYSREELLGEPLKSFIHPEDWPKAKKQIERREKGDVEQAQYEMRIHTKSGETRLVEVAGTGIDYRGTPAIIGTVQDITERRKLQQEVLSVQEEERRRLGQDLHDGIASQLTGVGIMLSTLSAKTQNEDIADRIEEVQTLVNESATDVRRLSRGLNPGGLSEGDLLSALEGLTQNTKGARFEASPNADGRNGTTLEIAKSSSTSTEDRATHLYRIAQEAVANARRHGEADEITLRLLQDDEALVLEVEDDGKGFNPEDTTQEGLGLRSMRHRAELLGANLTVESTPGKGTHVRCRLPA